MTTTLTDDQIGRLPRRVQQEIARLCANVEHWKAEATAGPDESDTFVRRAWDDGGRQPLGRGARVEFHGPRGAIEVRVNSRGAVEVTSLYADPLIVVPGSTNRIELETREL